MNRSIKRSFFRHFGRRMATGVALLVIAASPAASVVDSWVRVATGGLGDDTRKVHDLVIHDGYLWVATADLATSGGKHPRLFRALLRADSRWEEVTLPWRADSDGEISDLQPFGGDLYVASTFGQLWRYAHAGAWTRLTPWTGSTAILAVGVWELVPGTPTVCAFRAPAQISCGLETRTATPLPPVPLHNAAGVAAAQLLSFGDRLFLSVTGGSAGSRACEVHSFSDRWTAVTTDCFGNPDRPWAGDMTVFGERLYLGTGGHTRNAVYEVTDAGTYSEVAGAFAGLDMNRIPASAVAVHQLFMGSHVAGLVDTYAAVERTVDGSTWHQSNEPGFGVDADDVTSALAGEGTRLYAGVLNVGDGFEIWRRNFLLFETLREDSPAYRALLSEGFRQLLCLRAGVTGCPARVQLTALFGRVRLGFDTANHPADDAKLILALRKQLATADTELTRALALADQADKVAPLDRHKAALLYKEAARHLELSLRITQTTWEAAQAAVANKG
ncbi:MAG TPA: hypothetical protein VGV61_07875 [Thermoanaerobaculia bacterium]|jgi:hypothetical protein|nr:hypothetical protein [Thermoanaerobaculia bacterium]